MYFIGCRFPVYTNIKLHNTEREQVSSSFPFHNPGQPNPQENVFFYRYFRNQIVAIFRVTNKNVVNAKKYWRKIDQFNWEPRTKI